MGYMKKVKCFEKMQYVVSFPRQYREGNKYPIIIFLHGAGSRGENIDLLLDNPYFKLTEEHQEFPYITIAPQCFTDSWFDLFETLERFVHQILEEQFTDPERIYLMGASMGGYATWQLAMSLPECFAAIVPICGGGMYWNAARLINVPVWAFHGAKDPIVFADESRKMVDAVCAVGGNAKLTIYPENAHDAWSDTYRSAKVFQWLLTKKNENKKNTSNKYIGSKLFG